MNRRKLCWRNVRLSLFFAAVVFVILLTTMTFVAFGMRILWRIGIFRMGEEVFLTAAVCVLAGTVLAAIFSGYPLKPLREIMDATDRIAEGDYSVRINLKGPDDFRTLSSKFNHMVEEIGSVEMLRTDFVNNFSHEFKTPIVSIRGFAKALKWDGLTPSEREEYLDIIISESERLSTLAANVLYLSKIEKQTILTDKKIFNASEQLRRVIALLDQKFLDKRLEVVFDGGEVYLNGNEEMLKQVWINLLDNAVKFSKDNGTVRIRAYQNADSATFCISNEGSGMSQETQAHIFDKFYQGDVSHSTSGNGLGLSIVKKIVDLHGGSISVVSSDEGNSFEITLRGGVW